MAQQHSFKAAGLRRAVLALASLLFLAACGTTPDRSAGPEERLAPAGSYQSVGQASWYGKRFHGRQTASGEIYDMHGLTAAHRSLPFGTRVRVTNLANGRSVVLTINDRGPYVKPRIIDVSRQAAEVLGFLRDGVTRVRVETI